MDDGQGAASEQLQLTQLMSNLVTYPDSNTRPKRRPKGVRSYRRRLQLRRGIRLLQSFVVRRPPIALNPQAVCFRPFVVAPPPPPPSRTPPTVTVGASGFRSGLGHFGLDPKRVDKIWASRHGQEKFGSANVDSESEWVRDPEGRLVLRKNLKTGPVLGSHESSSSSVGAPPSVSGNLCIRCNVGVPKLGRVCVKCKYG